MSKKTMDVDAILSRAQPLVHQQAVEIQPYGHLVKLPNALAEDVCKESVENLNQLLVDTITLRDLYKKHHWQVAGPPSISCTSCSTNTTSSRTNWSMRSRLAATRNSNPWACCPRAIRSACRNAVSAPSQRRSRINKFALGRPARSIRPSDSGRRSESSVPITQGSTRAAVNTAVSRSHRGHCGGLHHRFRRVAA
jgi:hypothetical protein